MATIICSSGKEVKSCYYKWLLLYQIKIICKVAAITSDYIHLKMAAIISEYINLKMAVIISY